MNNDRVDTENPRDGPYMVKWECQFCGDFQDSREEHEEHVERMHYAELLREAEDVR